MNHTAEIEETETIVEWRGETIPRFVLGTAQLGMPYGIANPAGKPDEPAAHAVVQTAWDHGVRWFDTAQAYGDSERMLGDALDACDGRSRAAVITKLDPRLEPGDSDGIRASLADSCRRLRVETLWGVLLHRAGLLSRWQDGLGGALRRAREDGLLRYLGVSVYTVTEALAALRHPEIDLIQAPCNAWDQRMLREGVFDVARDTGKLCFVRSLYLQGALAMSPAALARRMPDARDASEHWHAISTALGVSVEALAIRFGRALGTPLVIGAETAPQVEMTARLLNEPPLSREVLDGLNASLAPRVHVGILNPSTWKLSA